MGPGHALGVNPTAGDKTGDILTAGRKSDAAVTKVQTPPDRIGRVCGGSMDNTLHGHQYITHVYLTGYNLAVRKITFGDTVEKWGLVIVRK